MSTSQFLFLGAKLLCSVYINMRSPPPFFFRLFLFVFILDEHPWHAIDVFVRLPEYRFNSAIILQPKKLFYFTLVYLVFQFSCIILLHNPWHAIDVFVRLFECHFKNRRSYVVNSIMTENANKNRLIMISSCIYFIIRFRFRSLGFGFHSWF